jgi:hypothetical protein
VTRKPRTRGSTPVIGMRFEIDFLPSTQSKPLNVRLVHQQTMRVP